MKNQMENKKILRERERRDEVKTALEHLKQFLISSSLIDREEASNMERVHLLKSIVNIMGEVKEQQRLAGMPIIVPDKFEAGLSHAKSEVSNVLASMPNVDEELRQRLVAHLGKRRSHNEERASNSRNIIEDKAPRSPNSSSDGDIDVEN